MIKTLVAIAALLAVVYAFDPTRVEMEADAKHFPEWTKTARISDAMPMKLTFQLRMRNIPELERIAFAVSDPSSPETYGKHLTLDQVNELTAPSEQSFALVERWLAANGVTAMARSSSMVEAHMSAALAQELLATEFHYFVHTASRQVLVRASRYSLPASIAAEVAFVGGVRHLPRVYQTKVGAPRQAQRQDGPTAEFVDPSVVKTLFNSSGVKGTSSSNSQAVTQFLGQYADSADLDEFFLLFERDALGNKPTYEGYDGVFAGMEASLDIQYIMSIGLDVPTWFWSMPNNNQTNEEPFLSWLEQIENMTSIPILWSVSYGEPEWALPSDYLQMVDAHFAKMAARGLTIFFASGDSGADCQPTGLAFAPDFPSSSPWITTVGGTELVADKSGDKKEIVATLSGGGFSNVFAQQSWQASAIEAYLNNSSVKKPAQKYFNISGRAYPDISALAADVIIVIDLLPQPGIGGTSCASPMSAGLFALLNDLRLNAGKPALGFVTPFIYSLNGVGFTDITVGSNSGSNEGEACDGVGFRASQGWDPASGWGSPQYGPLADAVSSLP